MDPSYVNCVKFCESVHIFVTGTSSGEVKLWSQHECHPLGTLNSNNWNGTSVMDYITATYAKHQESLESLRSEPSDRKPRKALN